MLPGAPISRICIPCRKFWFTLTPQGHIICAVFPSAQTSLLGLGGLRESWGLCQQSRECRSHLFSLKSGISSSEGSPSAVAQRPLFIPESSHFMWSGDRANKSTRGMGSHGDRDPRLPSEGFSLNLLPKASPGERVWTQQSQWLQSHSNFLWAWEEMESVTFLSAETPSRLHRSQGHREKRPGPGARRPGLSLCPCPGMSWVPTSVFGHSLFQREFRRLTSPLATSQG